MFKCNAVGLAIILVSWVGTGNVARAESPDAAAFLGKTGVNGGLCLVIGATDTVLATALAEKSPLYVQVLQSDAKLAAAWGLAVANSTDRENVSVRNAAFDPAHYDSDLFNLIVVEDAELPNKAKLADLYRILVPNGCVAFRDEGAPTSGGPTKQTSVGPSLAEGRSSASAVFAAEAKRLKMETLSVGPFQAVFRKPVLPLVWKPAPLAVKWRAGPTAGGSGAGFSGLASGSGKFFYWEPMEVEGEQWRKGRYQLFARDEYNGRVLWTREEPVGWNPLSGSWSMRGSMAADNRGRLFAVTGDGKLVCLDADTGKQRFVLMEKGAGGVIEICNNDKYVLACGKVFSAEDGKLLWTMPPLAWGGKIKEFVQLPKAQKWPAQYYVDGDSIYFCDGKTLKSGKLADGKMQQFALEGIPNPELYGGLVLSGRHVLVCTGRNISSVDKTSGKLLWSYLWPVPDKDMGNTWAVPYGDKLVLYRRVHNIDLTELNLVTGTVELEKTVPIASSEKVSACASCRFDLGDYIIDKERWVNKKTLDGTKVISPGSTVSLPTMLPCASGASLAKDAELFFSTPGRKSSRVLAFGSMDIAAPSTNELGWKRLQKFGQATSSDPTKEGDWPMFRGSAAMGNSVKAAPGDKPVKVWETAIGLGGKSFGVMCGERTGLTQPVVAYGLAIVSDIEGQRIVACDVADGKQKWTFHVGSTVEYSPTLYNGLCLFRARDGWVYCLDAKTGGLVWKNLIPSVERYIGGHERLESAWPPNLNVAVADGLGYIFGPFEFHKQKDESILMAFKPETGELATTPTNAPVGRRLTSPYGGLQYIMEIGNSLPRLYAEKNYPKMQDGRAEGKLVVFDDALSVAFTFVNTVVEGDWRNVPKAWPSLKAMKDNPKVPLWEIAPSELVVDDIVLTPQRIYCVGHYQRVAKGPEFWVVSREDGKVINTISVEGFPAFLGMSAAGNRLFIATREGKLICYEGK